MDSDQLSAISRQLLIYLMLSIPPNLFWRSDSFPAIFPVSCSVKPPSPKSKSSVRPI